MSNTRFPFDILSSIFSYYEETIEFPLENLLLVCQFWNAAALECKHIWSKFDIDIKDEPTALFWAHQVPRRLDRSGPYVPIFLTLQRNNPISGCSRSQSTCPRFLFHSCKCHKTLDDSIETILRAIIGPDGSLCARWREIDLRLPRDFSIRIPFFFYPTPQLTSLTLGRVKYRLKRGPFPFLPSVPSLRQIDVAYGDLPCLPNINDATKIRFVNIANVSPVGTNEVIVPKALAHAKQVRSLELKIRGYVWLDYITLPTILPSLEHLRLAGTYIPDNMKEVQAPSLRELNLKFDECPEKWYSNDQEDQPIRTILECHGIPFHQLDILSIAFNRRYNVEIGHSDWNNYYRLLRLCNSVKRISGNKFSTIILLRLLKEDCKGAGALLGRTVTISNGEESKELRPGKQDRLEDIEEFARNLGWPLTNEEREVFLQRLYEDYW